MNNNPLRYTDPSGHRCAGGGDEDINGNCIPSGNNKPSIGMARRGTATPTPASVATQKPAKPNKVSEQGINFIKKWEVFIPNLYNDDWNNPNVIGNCTIGYGQLVHVGECDGRIEEQSYIYGITEEQATELLRNRLATTEQVINESVKVDLTQNQFDALASFAYNVGEYEGGFLTSDLLQKLNQGDYESVPAEMLRWVLPEWATEGLTRRRTEEGLIFMNGTYP